MSSRALPILALLLGTTVAAKPARHGGSIPVQAHPAQPGLSVADFAPKAGPAGTQVTITGRGFLPTIKVHIGGRPVSPISVAPNAIVFAVPARSGDGTIVVHQPGTGTPLTLGTFTIQADQELTRVTPLAGPGGTRVELLGSGFRDTDQVSLGANAVRALELTPSRIVVEIPTGATTGFLMVSRPGGKTAKSLKPFVVTLPAPVIASFSPTSGPPGMVVRIIGDNFAPTDQPFFGKDAMAIRGRGPGWFEVVVPANARGSAAISMRSPRGTTVGGAFTLVLPPIIASFQPMVGPPGSRVAIKGDHFLPGDTVRIGGIAVIVENVTMNELVVRIPDGARTGRFEVVRGEGVVASRLPFEVVVIPNIASFAPTAGPPGTRVTLTGSGFGPDTVIIYGVERLKPTARNGDTGLDIVIPPRATDQPFVVKTRGGEVRSADVFRVQVHSQLMAISPAVGPVGIRVIVRGRNFNPTDAFFLNDLPVPIVERRPNEYVVIIPPGATSGNLVWESYGRRETSPLRFEVLVPPSITRFSPANGPIGTRVTLVGDNFGPAAKVWLGRAECLVIKRIGSTQLLVAIPPGSQGRSPFSVDSQGQRAQSQDLFDVAIPPPPPPEPAGHPSHEHGHEHPHEVGDHHHHPHVHPHRPGTNHHHPL